MLIVPYSPSLPGQRTMISILGIVIQGPDCWSFNISRALVPTADSISKLLIGCIGGQPTGHWSDN